MYKELEKIININTIELMNEKDLYNNYPIDYADIKSIRILLNKSMLLNINLNNNIKILNQEKIYLKNDIYLFYIFINFGAIIFSLYYFLKNDINNSTLIEYINY